MTQSKGEQINDASELPSPLRVATTIPDTVREEYQRRLIHWFHENGRDFPWRHAEDPFHILVAELLLQKTASGPVEPIYREFVSRYPTPAHVVETPLEKLQQLIAPLGLLYRAERLQALSSAIITKYGGDVPSNLAELLTLKGVGRYVASAVLLFAYKQPIALLDQNVIRVLRRVFEIRALASRPHTDTKLWEAANMLVPQQEAREYNLAILDLSALICRPAPRCDSCPINHLCLYYAKVSDKE